MITAKHEETALAFILDVFFLFIDLLFQNSLSLTLA